MIFSRIDSLSLKTVYGQIPCSARRAVISRSSSPGFLRFALRPLWRLGSPAVCGA